jgi:hypothetical protein
MLCHIVVRIFWLMPACIWGLAWLLLYLIARFGHVSLEWSAMRRRKPLRGWRLWATVLVFSYEVPRIRIHQNAPAPLVCRQPALAVLTNLAR